MNIAFAGFGIEGESAYRYFQKYYPNAEFAVYDSSNEPKKQLPENVVFYGNLKNFHNINADVVVRTPSISPERITTNGIITSATIEFFAKCKHPIIGVTGTKGKGTTASLIAEILKNAGLNAWLIGNIGVPALDKLDEINAAENGVVVYELSSFQLWDLQQSPAVSVVLTIEPEHLDVHGSFQDYVAAKANIAKYQDDSDSVVYYANNDYSVAIADQSEGKRFPYDGGIVRDGYVVFNDIQLVKLSEVALKGDHNLQNIHAALLAASVFTSDTLAMSRAIKEFKGLPHRIEEVGVRQGVLYVNDSFSSAPPATLAAVKSYSNPTLLIMGGYDRGLDYTQLVNELSQLSHLKRVILIGQTAKKINDLFTTNSNIHVSITSTLNEAVTLAQSEATSGDVVIFSPGCASFDMFKDFVERGEEFRSLIGKMQREFIFESYAFNETTKQATFKYSFDGVDEFCETVQFSAAEVYNATILDNALRLAFFVIGTSYCKLYPGSIINMGNCNLDILQSEFMNTVYQEGMSQYAYENQLTRKDLAHFIANENDNSSQEQYKGKGIISLQSGGKDSLLTATLLEKNGFAFDSFYIASRGGHYPTFIDDISDKLHIIERSLDLDGLKKHVHSGALSGHVPVTYIVLSIALVQAILQNKDTVVASIGHEGEEPHEWIDDLAVSHQWSKTWKAEQLFAEYVRRYISKDIRIGSPLRKFTELKIAELFAKNSWDRYSRLFSSCNIANYQQGNDNSTLRWCGDCPKCANSYLLFAPFVPSLELKELFSGQDLFEKPNLQHTFKGLLGVEGVMKPFECVGEVDELRYAYGLAMKTGAFAPLSFSVPASSFDYEQLYPAQEWTQDLF